MRPRRRAVARRERGVGRSASPEIRARAHALDAVPGAGRTRAVGVAVAVCGGMRDGKVDVGTGGGELGPSGALEVLAGGETEEGGAVAAGVEHEQGVWGCVTREGEQDRAWAGCDARGGRGGLAWARERGKGGGGEEDDVCVWDEL